MIKYFVYIGFICSSAFSQEKGVEYYASTINVSDLQKHLTIIASDSLEGRETGQVGQKMAAEYIASHFSNIGIKPYKKNLLSRVPSFITKINSKQFRYKRLS